ncbi:metallophosphoesterase family protein [Arthrobacter zhaoguopingii]|uniref:metallophosphoesterase family protein n=1 Tax=Arthrobacter zhaoguopingii TaxID=2681491 RepID=UPI001FE24E09|nr:metallophosphoesterase [Arthrobacter zhaoguopingii]
MTLALAVPLAFGVGSAAVAQPAPAEPQLQPANTRSTDEVLYREGFDSLAPSLQPRSNDPGIADGQVGFTHTAPKGWGVDVDPSMAGQGVDEWRGWSFTTREFWVDAEDQMRDRFARAQNVIAVADSDEFADVNSASHDFKTTLVSDQISVHKQSSVELSFDSHYRGWEGQSATVTVEFDGSGEFLPVMQYDSQSVTNNYDGRVINTNERLTVEVPEGAKRAVFRWNFQAKANSWYWAIDSVTVQKPLAPTKDPATSAWIVSDIQGHPQDLAHALGDLSAVRPDAAGLLMVGDIVNSGSVREWDEVRDVMTNARPILPETIAAAIGNHESYTGEPWTTHRDRFLEFADRDRIWDEYVLEGAGGSVPVLVLGQEDARPPEVPMSEEQVLWMQERLAYWTKQNKQVMIVSHFPLGDTVSASWIPGYDTAYEHNDRLIQILSNYPNAVLFTGHTHYPFELGDWAVQRRTETGHPDGFWAVNTGAIQTEWDARGEDTATVREITTRNINRGLTVDVFDDRLVIDARDFGPVTGGGDNTINEVVRTVTIPNPLVKK